LLWLCIEGALGLCCENGRLKIVCEMIARGLRGLVKPLESFSLEERLWLDCGSIVARLWLDYRVSPEAPSHKKTSPAVSIGLGVPGIEADLDSDGSYFRNIGTT
jgi:hypothetical protein